MLRIRQEQLNAFSEAQVHRANLEMVEYARNRFPHLLGSEPQAEILKLVQIARQTAKSYKIEMENDVATFVDLTVMYGPSYVTANWARDVFHGDDIDGAEKMESLRQRIVRSGTEI